MHWDCNKELSDVKENRRKRRIGKDNSKEESDRQDKGLL